MNLENYLGRVIENGINTNAYHPEAMLLVTCLWLLDGRFTWGTCDLFKGGFSAGH